MPYRASSLALGLLGFLIIIGLVLVGADLVHHARRGAPWKQRLVGAGLMLLAAVGLVPGAGCAKKDSPKTPRDSTSDPRVTPEPSMGAPPARGMTPDPRGAGAKPLPNDPWKRIAVVVSEARAIAMGRRGPFPFDKAGKARVLQNLERARKAVDELQGRGRLNPGEAGLWKADLVALTSKIRGFRTTERQNVSCYSPRPMPRPAEVSVRRMRGRLGFLAKLAAAKQLHPRVVHKVLVQIEADVAVLSSKTAAVGLRQPADQKLAAQVAKDAPAYIKAIRQKLGVPIPSSPALEKTPQWDEVKHGWTVIAPLAANSSGSTRGQRSKANQAMGRAGQAISALRLAGRLTDPEAALLNQEAARLRSEMTSARPKDANVKCYKMKQIKPARASLSRTSRRLDALNKLVVAGKVTRVVLAKVLPAVEADLRVLGDPKAVAELPKTGQAAAKSLHTKVTRLVAKLKALPTR